MDFTRYHEEFLKIDVTVSRLWNGVSFINVAEIVNNEVDLRDLEKRCWSLNDSLYKTNKEMGAASERLSDDEYNRYENEISELDSKYSLIDSKISAIEGVINHLQKIQEEFEENDSLKFFDDSEEIKINENNQFIKLERLI